MVSGISTSDASNFDNLYGARATSEDGRKLAALIEQNVGAMVSATILGRPAVTPLMGLIANDLSDRLIDDDKLMQTFGYLIYKEMEVLGFQYSKQSSAEVRWPFNDRTSTFAVYLLPNRTDS